MSRSFRKTPIIGNTGNKSCKLWRTYENRKYRSYVKNLMRHERYDDIQGFCGRFGNEWDSPRDGKNWFGDSLRTPCFKQLVCFRWGITRVYNCTEKEHVWLCGVSYRKYMRK